MILFLFESVDELTCNYHSEGGLVVIAQDRAAADELIAKSGAKPTEEEWADAETYSLAADYEPSVVLFPDAGCC